MNQNSIKVHISHQYSITYRGSNGTNFNDVENTFQNTTIKMLLVDDNKINLLVLEKQLKKTN
jgi:hypothetical protein